MFIKNYLEDGTDMFIEIACGCLIGGCIGAVSSLLPGVGSITASVVGSTIGGIINPVVGAAATVSSWVVSTMLGSAKESIDSSLCGDANIEAAAPETPVEPKKVCRSLYSSKLFGMAIGLALNYFAGGTLLSLSTLPITWFVVILIGGILFSQMQRYWPIIVTILVGSQLYFMVGSALGVNNLILPLGGAVYIIPSLIEKMADKKEKKVLSTGDDGKVWAADPFKVIVSSIISAITPGIGSSLFVLATSRKTNLISQLSVAAAGCAIEAYGLAALIQGTLNAKAGMAVMVGLQFAGPWMIWLFVACALVSGFFLQSVYDYYSKLVSLPGVHFIVLVFTGFTTVQTAGPILGIVLIIAGIGLRMVMKAVGAPKTLGSLIWLGPILLR